MLSDRCYEFNHAGKPIRAVLMILAVGLMGRIGKAAGRWKWAAWIVAWCDVKYGLDGYPDEVKAERGQ